MMIKAIIIINITARPKSRHCNQPHTSTPLIKLLRPQSQTQTIQSVCVSEPNNTLHNTQTHVPIASNDKMTETGEDEEDYFKPLTEDLDEDSFFELDGGTLLLLEQAGQSLTSQGNSSIVLALESVMAEDPKYAKFFKEAKKLHVMKPRASLPFISSKIVNSPKSKFNRVVNKAIYLNVVLLSQSLLSKKGAVSLTIYHMKYPNGMQPQPTFKWCILSYKVVFDTVASAQAAYVAVSRNKLRNPGYLLSRTPCATTTTR